jgi:hypothetical protein
MPVGVIVRGAIGEIVEELRGGAPAGEVCRRHALCAARAKGQ